MKNACRFRLPLILIILILLALISLFAAPVSRASESVALTALEIGKARQTYAKPLVDKPLRGERISIAGRTFEHGLYSHSNFELWIDLGGTAERFEAWVGVDDSAHAPGTVQFSIIGDGKKLWDSGVMKYKEPARRVDLDLRGIKTLILMADDGGDGIRNDQADWADARIVYSGARPRAVDQAPGEAVILTPRPGPAPRINGPAVYGCRPGNPFIYRIPTTGRRPIEFSATGLPESLKLDAARGIITGAAPARGEYAVTLHAKNPHGEATRAFRIVSGDALVLTPPMGWNDWYAYGRNVTDARVRQAADAMVASGMADAGYQYVSIDDCWMNALQEKDPLRVGPLRDERGNILANKHFPDMKALTDHIHALGLKAGIYTSPGPLTCAKYAGSYQHEAQDAKQFADWGFDLLKYDWCSYRLIVKGDTSAETYKKPYKMMGDLLKAQRRDIVFNLCQYGRGDVWEWGAEVGGHSWRTANDLGGRLNGIFEVALKNAEHGAWSKPGAWNDPDYLMLGYRGGRTPEDPPQRFALTPNEQYAYMSLWCLMAAPLFYSGDMSRLDDFTLGILCNPEVIEVDQDPLGRCAEVRGVTGNTFVMVKAMADGSRAIGLFNRGRFETKVGVKWSELGVSGSQRVRDLWRQKDLGGYDAGYETTVPTRGVVLLRIAPGSFS